MVKIKHTSFFAADGKVCMVSDKPSVSPERLAEILYECTGKYRDKNIPYWKSLAAELLKVLDIREKE